MTVSYQYDVASSASGGFIRLLFRWRGSVWKVVYRDMLVFLVSYVLLTVLYWYALSESQQKVFEKIVYFCSTFMDLIPLSFMLGFYVSFIAARWWSQFIAIPWPDKLMNIVAMYIPGLDEASRVVRRTLMRYLNLSLVLVLRSISMAVKRRFPTKEHLVEAGFMTKTELEMFQSVPSTEFNTFWIPCTWFINVLREARQECKITDSNGLKLIMEELNEFRSKCGLLWGYDWISIPLVYTQVVTMATYAFYVACMFGRQQINPSTEPHMRMHRHDYYIPIFTIFQLMFYMGLLKVAEQLINPFGDDDEDFELNWIIDRHMKVSYLGVDTLNGTPPPLVRDNYYDELDVKIPYTEASRSYKKKTYRGSVAYMQVPMDQQGIVQPDEETDEDKEVVSEGMGQRRPSIYALFNKSGNKGSRSSSYTNLENASLDSDWKASLPNLSQDAKTTSGSTGMSTARRGTVEMAKAEDDEMVLQEVVVDLQRPQPLAKTNGLRIPGALPKEKKSSSLLSVIRNVSPKIAPKFPREKLKSMFRKRKLSAAFPFIKVKGVRFSRGTKEHDGSSSDASDSDAGRRLDEMEVDITISNPELTEAEKVLGVYPYYAKQGAVTPEQLTRALTSLAARRRSSQDGLLEEPKELPFPHSRSASLPNIQDEPVIATAHVSRVPPLCKPLSAKKDKSRKHRKRRKSSPPPPLLYLPSSDGERDQISDTSDSSRRNTLPQITLTKYDHPSSEHLDLAAVSSSGLDAGQVPIVVPKSVPKPRSTPSSKKPPESETSSSRTEAKPSKPESEKAHSTRKESVKSAQKPLVARTTSLSLQVKPQGHSRTPSPSPAKSKSLGPKQIKSKPKIILPTKSGTLSSSESAPSSPTRSIPVITKTPSVPQTPKQSGSGSPKPSVSISSARPERRDSQSPKPRVQHQSQSVPASPSVISDPEDMPSSRTDGSNQAKRDPPIPVPRKGSRGKK